ncbi:MAG: redoxin domain-containing protein, partial [Bacteroidota bacterium]|nr:redoxin domain-containing protein [Bacteroidota bacterium]
VDNNFNNGYWIQLYEGDKLKKGSNVSLSQFYQGMGGQVSVDANNDKALQILEKEFLLYPENKKAYLASYIRLYGVVNKAEAPALIQKEIENVLKTGLKEEADYTLVENLYNLAKLPEQAKLITSLKKQKFPNGRWAIGETIQKFNLEKDITAKEQMLKDITQKIKTDENWKYLESSLPFFQSAIPSAYLANKDYIGFKNAAANIKDQARVASLYNNAAWEMQKDNDNLKLAEELSARSLVISKNEWKNPLADKPGYLSKKQWDKSREITYATYADTYAMVLYRMGEYKKGLTYARENLKFDKGMATSSNNTYALLAEKTVPVKQYKKELEQFVKDGKSTPEIKDILKRVYTKQQKSDAGFDNYIATLEKENYLQMLAELRKSMINEAAPSFALYDLNKNKVDIADLKNKIVVVDFWATWCGPCKASFPAMQKMVNKFKDNPDVKFVFVDTWEKGENKQKDASDFIAAHKYTFHVLQDNDDKVVEQFKVNGIPTKFIIDKNGIIRFKAIGYEGDDKLVNELTAMLELVQKS